MATACAADHTAAPVRRVLLVTARSSSLLLLERACRHERGARVRFFTDPRAAALALTGWRPDAVVLDIASSGRAVAALVAATRSRYPEVPLAVLADRLGPRLAEAVRRTGADGALLADAGDPLAHLARLRALRRAGTDHAG